MEESTSPSFRILVVGGGIAGLVVSIGLQRNGHRVIVIENTPELQTMGGSLLIPPSAARVLDNFGVWERILAADIAPVSHTTFRYADGEVLESIDYAALKSRFGYP
jgi:salicylate hydroxylase